MLRGVSARARPPAQPRAALRLPPRPCVTPGCLRAAPPHPDRALWPGRGVAAAASAGGAAGDGLPQRSPAAPAGPRGSRWAARTLGAALLLLGSLAVSLAAPKAAAAADASAPPAPAAEPAAPSPLLGPRLVRTANDDERAARRRDRRAAREGVENAIDAKVSRRRLGAQPWQMRPPKRYGSVVPDPADWPQAAPGELEDGFGVPGPYDGGDRRAAPATAGPVELARRLSYTQLWSLVREGHVDRVTFTPGGGPVTVVTRASAPGGVRSDRVGLPYDPAFLDHLLAHGVTVTSSRGGWPAHAAWILLRAAFPFAFLTLAVRAAYRLGTKTKRKATTTDKLNRLDAGRAGVDFRDVAGLAGVKDEVMEIVSFLKNPARFIALGARSPAGVLLVGPPGTGKTLLARAVAGEAGVPFYCTSGSEFLESLVGIGASRVRSAFETARANAPCILFIDEFDGVGQARSEASGGNEDAVQTINQLLTEMDGFDDNTGVVVMAATNRPGSLDAALTRPGRFDRMIVLPLPDVTGRAAILRVHARGKRVEEGVDYDRVARTTAGFTGAMLMSLMNGAALVAVRRGASSIAEADIMQALEDAFYTRTGTDGRKVDSDDVLAPRTRRAVAVYEAGRALVGSLLPQYEELAKVVCCPGGAPTGYAHFVPLEEHLETGVMTRGYLESLLVARMAGRAAERLVLGEGGVSTASAGDVLAATSVARELVLRAGLGRSLGPLSIMDTEAVYGRAHAARSVADLGTATAAAAAAEVEALVCAAEAKATAGIAANWGAFKALTEALLEREEMSGAEVRAELARAGAKPFADPCSDGYAWAGGSALLMTDGADASSSVTATADALARHALNADGAPDLATRRATRVNPFFSPAGTALPRFGGPGVDGAAGLPRLAGLPSDEQGDE